MRKVKQWTTILVAAAMTMGMMACGTGTTSEEPKQQETDQAHPPHILFISFLPPPGTRQILSVLSERSRYPASAPSARWKSVRFFCVSR